MAMLAEPRRKQKWTLNPRGKQWSEDSNKFGQKMLEKMGWTSGKGLGANEQGMTEHVKVSYKNNQSGIGFKDTGDQWTQHQTDFNDFLSQLQEQNSSSDTSAQINTEQVVKDESLELKSKQSRARVHYHKFTRGKDVKKYSSKDLANIFGKKDLKEASKAEEAPEETVEEPTGSKENIGGVLTIKGGNIDEYFKNKLPNFAKKGKFRETEDSEGEYEPRLGFGFGNEKADEQQNSGFAFSNGGLDLDYREEPKVFKKEKTEFAYDNPTLSEENHKESVEKCTVPFSSQGFVNPALNLNDSPNEKNNGAEFEVSRVEFGLDNDALDLSDENGKKKRVTFNDRVEYNTDVIKKKKKKKGKGKLDKFEVDNSKLKKKTKENETIESSSGCGAAAFVNEALDVEPISDEINDNELNERKTKKSKRKKNRRESNLETIEEIAEENSQVNDSEVGEAILLDEAAPRKSKRSKKDPESENDLELIAEVEVLGAKKKDKKAKKSQETEITVLAEISRKIGKSKKNKVPEESQSSDALPEIIQAKKKSKRRSKSKSAEGEEATEIKLEEINDRVETPNGNVAAKRKSTDENVDAKLSKRSKLTENTENVQRNELNTKSPVQYEKTGRRPKKTFKSLFTKAPTLYFTGSNINEMPGYGASIMEIRR